jgi:hypothetical protein
VSEFLCGCGELIAPSEGVCKKCGGRPVSMDGFSNSELEAMENAEPCECEDEDDGEEKHNYPEDDPREDR